MKRLLCCRKHYAEVYSQAYSVDDDRYLAKQKCCPSSSSMLSSQYSSAANEDDLIEFMTAVDLFKSGSDLSVNIQAKRASQTPLASMALKTVTSIEEQEAGDLDIEAQLDQDDESYQSIERNISEEEEQQLDAMDYHVVSKYCAKTNGRRKKVSPIFLVKEKIMRMRKVDSKTKDNTHTNKTATEETEDSNESCCDSDPSQIEGDGGMIMRNASSTSGLYIESSSYDS
mmetsp:Transcript_30921/g.45719  ORF Transcript_30921/g.45719 Transcript_30921/m.45719 type:complete len:228 (+) Transcript_30921:107-790(+)